MKTFCKTIFILYLLTLLWLVLFKLSADPFGVLLHYQTRSLTLIPFAGGSMSEMIENFVVFLPLGLLLGVVFKRISFWQKLAAVFVLSFGVETLQFLFAIGRSDVTDVITNTLGGLAGLALYGLCAKYVSHEKLDRFIAVTIAVILVLLLVLRFFVFRVRY